MKLSLSMFDPRLWRLRGKITFAFLLLTLVPLIIVRMINNQITRDALIGQGTLNLKYASAQTADKIDRYLATGRDDIIVARQMPEVGAFVLNPSDPATRANALFVLRALAAKSDYESVAIINTEGKVILSSDERENNVDVRGFRPVQEALEGKISVSDPVLNPFDNSPSVGFAAPVTLAGNNVPLGVVRSRLSLYGIWAIVEADLDAAGRGSYGILLDEHGIRLAESISVGKREFVTQNLLYRSIAPLATEVTQRVLTERRFGNAKEIPVLALPDMANALAANKSVFETAADNSAERHQAAAAQLRYRPWRYVLVAPLSTFTSAADALTAVSLALGLLAALISVVAAFYTARAITRPIVQLTQIADRISLGELDAQVQVTSRDEIGELAEAIARMQASLQAAIERLRTRRTR